ncbi:MAG TPA: DUF6770 family protein [Puia sp.]|jgi:hypothetical protein|nr:DUF6770 family protein [Puia sp.]
MTTSKQSIRWALAVMLALSLPVTSVLAQGKLSIDKVYSAYLRNSGTIMAKGQIKGYFFFYLSDKIDRHTNEYTLQILDENLNKVQSIKFEDSKKLSLLESAYNGNSISFLFKNEDTKTLDMKIYDFDGKLKYTYSRGFDRKTDELMKQYETLHTDEGMNKNVFDIGDEGYVSVLPMRDGKIRTYEVDYYASDNKKQWTYVPNDDAEKYAMAEYLGCTDSLIILEVLKKNRTLGTDFSSHLVGINFVTKKKQWEIDGTNDQYNIVPSSVVAMDSGKLMLLASYYDKNQNIVKDFSRGLAMYEITTTGKVLTKTYNTWAGDFAKYLPTNSKGKIDDVGYLYIHKLIRTPDNRIFVVGEGYKRQANAAGIALNTLSVLSGAGTTGVGNTKIVITDMVMMEFNSKYKITNATIYDKTKNTAIASNMADYNSQHLLAEVLKAMGAFDYAFTTGDADNSNFAVCYGDWERSSEYHGQTFNAIRYNGKKFTTDKIELKSKASMMHVFPAKGGSIMIMEYFRKDKRLDFRLEKLG